jgi:peroxiredoxin
MRYLANVGVRSARAGASVLFLLVIAWFAAPVPALGDDHIAATAEDIQPLGAGDRAPRFAVRAVDGSPVVFDPDALERPAVLISFRGGWCPFCNMHLMELRHVVPDIAALGIDVLFLSGDRPELLFSNLQQETREAIDNLDYRILSDADAQAAMAFGIAFRATDTIARRHSEGDDIEGSSMAQHEVLPVPSVFAIDRQGTIAFAYSNPDYRVRLSADDLLRVARELAGAE